MTNQEFTEMLLLEYDRVTSGALPGYELSELSKFASRAQENLIIKKYNFKSNRLAEGFEETEKRTQDIGELVRTVNLTPAVFDSTKNLDNGVFVTLPNTLKTSGPTDFSDVFWFSVYESATTDKKDCDNNFIQCRVVEIGHDNTWMLDDPFNKPNFDGQDPRVFRLKYEGRKHELITDGNFNVTSYKIRYIRKPKPIDLTGTSTADVSELSDEVQREIIDETLDLLLKSTENPRVQVERQTIKE